MIPSLLISMPMSCPYQGAIVISIYCMPLHQLYLNLTDFLQATGEFHGTSEEPLFLGHSLYTCFLFSMELHKLRGPMKCTIFSFLFLCSYFIYFFSMYYLVTKLQTFFFILSGFWFAYYTLHTMHSRVCTMPNMHDRSCDKINLRPYPGMVKFWSKWNIVKVEDFEANIKECVAPLKWFKLALIRQR